MTIPSRKPANCVIRPCKRDATVGMVCVEHYQALSRHIVEIPSLFERLTPFPSVAAGDEPHQKPIFESKSPADDNSIALADLRSYDGPFAVMQQWQIRFWGRFANVHVTPTPTSEIHDLCLGMVAAWPRWARTERCAEFYRDMHHIWACLRVAVGEKAHLASVGVCEVCAGPIVFDIEALAVKCSHCGADYDVALAVQALASFYDVVNAPYWRDLCG